jgi:hypothetical protein
MQHVRRLRLQDETRPAAARKSGKGGGGESETAASSLRIAALSVDLVVRAYFGEMPP